MVRKLLIACAGAAVLAAPAGAQPAATVLMPGVTFHRDVQFTLHGPVVVNVIEGPKPTGLYALEPLLPGGGVRGRERVTSMEQRLSSTATVAGVNGDLFGSSGRPEGLFLDGGVVKTPPKHSRSSLAISTKGKLSVERIPFVGDWRGTGPRRALSTLNDAPGKNGTALVTPAWGTTTPSSPDAVEAVLPSLPTVTANTALTGTVSQVLHGGNHPVPPGGAVLMARGNAATRLTAEAPAGAQVTLHVILPGPFATAVAGIGGGPLLVRNGKAVFRAKEAFPSSWLVPRGPRTAVGQRADGRILFVAVDGGRPGYSAGMTNFELARELVSLGAVTAMGLDSGLSTTMAFDGELLNRPARKERPIGDALTLQYLGVQAPAPSADVLSPNGDAADEVENLAYKVVRPSTVSAVLLGPGGTKVTLDAGKRDPGSYRFIWSGLDAAGKLLPEGQWDWKVTAVDDLGRSSGAERQFLLDTTLKGLTLQPATLRRGSSLTVGVDLLHPAKVKVTVETRAGVVLRTFGKRSAGTGHLELTWKGKLAGGRRMPPGSYVVRVAAANQLGTAELTAGLRMARRR